MITQALASGAETTFRPPIWWLGIGLLLLAALTALTMHLFRNKGSKRFRALALTVVVALGAPVMMLDRIVVSGTGIEETGGIVTTRGFRYADVEYIHVTTRPGARARTVTVWEVHYKPDSALGLGRAGRGHPHWHSLGGQLGHHHGSLEGVWRPVPLADLLHADDDCSFTVSVPRQFRIHSAPGHLYRSA